MDIEQQVVKRLPLRTVEDQEKKGDKYKLNTMIYGLEILKPKANDKETETSIT